MNDIKNGVSAMTVRRKVPFALAGILVVVALVLGTIGAALATGSGVSPFDCITDNDPDTSFLVEEGGEPNGSSFSGRTVTANAVAGKTIESICIHGGPSAFALGGSGNGTNFSGDSDDPGRSSHSIPITAGGTFGIDREVGDGIDGCYQVTGMGTQTVTVTAVDDGPDANVSNDCTDLLHIDVFTEGGPPPVGGIAELRVPPADEPQPQADSSGPSPLPFVAGGLALGALALGAGGLYAVRMRRG